MNYKNYIVILSFLLPVFILFSSCDSKDSKSKKESGVFREIDRKKQKCKTFGKTNIKLIKQFINVYPNSVHFIDSFVSTRKTKWSAKIGLHGRYTLGMNLPIQLNKQKTKFSVSGDPTFYLNEVRSIHKRKDGKLSVLLKADSQRIFGLKKWKEIYDSNGKLTPLEIKIKRNKPYKYFDRYWKADFSG